MTGEVSIAEGLTVGYLAQEPDLDETKDVKGNIFEGVADKKAILDEFVDVSVCGPNFC